MFKFIFSQALNNVFVFEKVISSNFDGSIKGDISKKWINVEATHKVARILLKDFSGKVERIIDCIFVSS